MRQTVLFRVVAGLTLLAVTASCSNTRLPPISASGAGFKPLPDEAALWERSRTEERKLLAKVRLYDDPLLESYLQGVATRLTPPGMAANPAVHYRVRVIEDPTLNAFSFPHGSIYVHTGLLARLENEDQLATVLGHEMTHVERRHMLRFERDSHNKEVAFSVAANAALFVVDAAETVARSEGHGGAAVAIDVLGNVGVELSLGLALVASVEGYGRELEADADHGGFAKMAVAGYRLSESPKVYEALQEDYSEPKQVEAFFFGNHPHLSERIENSRRYAGLRTSAAARDRNPVDPGLFARRILPVVRDDARLNIELGRLKIAEAELGRARASMPEDPLTQSYWSRLKNEEEHPKKDGR
jgi:predicted Zn-dependent protease